MKNLAIICTKRSLLYPAVQNMHRFYREKFTWPEPIKHHLVPSPSVWDIDIPGNRFGWHIGVTIFLHQLRCDHRKIDSVGFRLHLSKRQACRKKS